jgi:hypothetical protein
MYPDTTHQSTKRTQYNRRSFAKSCCIDCCFEKIAREEIHDVICSLLKEKCCIYSKIRQIVIEAARGSKSGIGRKKSVG